MRVLQQKHQPEGAPAYTQPGRYELPSGRHHFYVEAKTWLVQPLKPHSSLLICWVVISKPHCPRIWTSLVAFAMWDDTSAVCCAQFRLPSGYLPSGICCLFVIKCTHCDILKIHCFVYYFTVAMGLVYNI